MIERVKLGLDGCLRLGAPKAHGDKDVTQELID